MGCQLYRVHIDKGGLIHWSCVHKKMEGVEHAGTLGRV